MFTRSAALAVLVASGVGSCGRHQTTPPSPASAPSASSTPLATNAASDAETDAPLTTLGDASAAGAPLPWAEAVRLERWDEASRALDALEAADKARADVRYVRARVALARGDYPPVLPLLDGLQAQLPLLTEDIALRRAEAKVHVGPFGEAGDYYAARTGAASQLAAARAYDKAKDAAKARLACDRVVTSGGRTRAQEAEARATRFRLGEKSDGVSANAGSSQASDVEIADARWLAVNAPDLAVGSAAGAAHARLDPKHPLTGTELMTRAKALAEAGRLDEALRAVDDSASAPQPTVHLDRIRAKGYMLYRAKNRYLEASKILAEAATNAGQYAAEDAFHAARALSRADKDDDAIPAYEKVALKYKTTKWGDEASYFVPYLRILHAEWKDAAHGFDEYAKKYPDGVHKMDAARNRAIAHLMIKDYKTARTLFERLSVEESELLASARMANMAALAAWKDGDQTHALARWTDVARSRPLTYPALVARARLALVGAPIPPTIEPAESGEAPPPLAITLPAPVDLLHRVGLDGDAEAALRERENAVVSSAGPRSAEALCAAYGMLGRGRRRYELSQRSIPSAVLGAAPGARTRWAWECTFPSPYEGNVLAVEAKDKLPPGLVYAVMRQESAYDPDVVSPARAVGLLQLLPETAKTLAATMQLPHEDARLTSPPYNIALGAHYLRELLDRFHGQIPLAAGAYNGGPEAIARWVSRAPGLELDVFVERIPYKETRDYIGRVMGNLARYGYLRDGEAGVPKVDLTMTP